MVPTTTFLIGYIIIMLCTSSTRKASRSMVNAFSSTASTSSSSILCSVNGRGRQRHGLQQQQQLTWSSTNFPMTRHQKEDDKFSYTLRKFTTTSTTIWMSAMEEEENDDSDSDDETNNKKKKTITSVWNINGLKKEISRLTVRCHKKISKSSQRIQKANIEIERLLTSETTSDDELESCPNIQTLENELVNWQTRLKQLNQLEVYLYDIKGKNTILSDHIAQLALDLDVNDEPPIRPIATKKKKEKGPRNMTSFRLPYRRYYTENKTEIRVGKQAEDNDELTLSPKHRDSADWWMHASGCPGSHVVIRCHDSSLDSAVIDDAAALAARQSKCTGGVIKVSLTRARDIKKPPGAKAGLVQLTGGVQTVTVNMKKAQSRLDRLDKTMLIN